MGPYPTSHTSVVLWLSLAWTLFFSVPFALAQDGWYVGGGGGKAWFADDSFEGAVSGPVTQTFGGAFGFCGATGYGFAENPIRLEGEVCALRADVDDLRNTLTTFHGGSDRHVAGMANLYYQRALGGRGGRTAPYGGVGIGFDVERWGLDLTTPAGVRSAGRFDTRTFFAYQIKAGVNHTLTDRLGLVTGYRYFRTQERELTSPSAPARYPHSAQGIHLLELGLRLGW